MKGIKGMGKDIARPTGLHYPLHPFYPCYFPYCDQSNGTSNQI